MKTVEDFKYILYAESEAEVPMVQRFLSLPNARKQSFTDEEELNGYLKYAKENFISKEVLILKPYPGRLYQKCPGSDGMICCNYMLINTCFDCLYNCAYCFLQMYLNSFGITQFTNVENVIGEIAQDISERGSDLIRIGTGEYTDSLMMDEYTGIATSLIENLAGNRQVMLEFKTKSSNVDHLLEVPEKGNTVLAWSLNTEKNIADFEEGTATLDERLHAAAKAGKAGYYLAFHFDPIIHYPGCMEEYKEVVGRLYSAVDAQRILWISMGGVRFLKGFKEIIRTNFPDEKMTLGEFLPCSDGKMRYFRPQRIAMYKELVSSIGEFTSDTGNIANPERVWRPHPYIYLCMENDNVWEEVFDEDFTHSDHLEASLHDHLKKVLSLD